MTLRMSIYLDFVPKAPHSLYPSLGSSEKSDHLTSFLWKNFAYEISELYSVTIVCNLFFFFLINRYSECSLKKFQKI